MIRSRMVSILTDSQLWAPVLILVLGTALLICLR